MTTAAPEIELYDSDVKKIMAIQLALQERYQGSMRSYTAFEHEARERFAEAGLLIEVNWYTYEVSGQPQEGLMPEIKITGRTPGAFVFDHDRQVHEVTHNLLRIPGEEGVIKTDPETLRRFLDDQGGGHAHGHDHSR